MIETLSYKEQRVSRIDAKKNLHKIRESTLRRKIENMLFDRLWYENRETSRGKRRHEAEEKKAPLSDFMTTFKLRKSQRMLDEDGFGSDDANSSGESRSVNRLLRKVFGKPRSKKQSENVDEG